MVALVRELKQRGYRVAAIKHCPHGHQLDQQGKDSARMLDTGADAVMAASPGQVTLVRRVPRERGLPDLVADLGEGYDIVLAEGFHDEPVPTVMVIAADGEGRSLANGELVATVGEEGADFGFGRASDLASLLESRFLDGA